MRLAVGQERLQPLTSPPLGSTGVPTENGLCNDCKGRHDMEEDNQSLSAWPSIEWLLQLDSNRSSCSTSGGITSYPHEWSPLCEDSEVNVAAAIPDNCLCHLHCLSPNTRHHVIDKYNYALSQLHCSYMNKVILVVSKCCLLRFYLWLQLSIPSLSQNPWNCIDSGE